MRHTFLKLNTRLLALAMALALLMCMVPTAAAAEASGTCGDNLSWSLSGDTLTITGSGPMYDYPESTMAPWYEYRKSISAVRLPDGLTTIGDLAFYDCSALQSVVLPNSVTEIGWHAFALCKNMTMFTMSSSMQSIAEGAFKECVSLHSLRLPSGLKTIGFQAFYRCEALTSITVPASVTELGMTTFAFCYQLVRAEIHAPITVIPDWTFFGCNNLAVLVLPETVTGASEYAFFDCVCLTDVQYSGSEENRSQIESDIKRDVESQIGSVDVSSEERTEDNSSFSAEETENQVIANSSSTSQTENVTISSNTTMEIPKDGGETSSQTQVTITVENQNGWADVEEKLQEIVQENDRSTVDIYLKDDVTVPEGALSALPGQTTTVTVHNSNGATWKIDFSTIVSDETKTKTDLSYERTDATEKQLEKMGCTVGYQITFAEDVQINAEVMIKLLVEHARKTATLYQTERGGELKLLQTVVVDDAGYAHFYLGAVDSETEYLIGIEVPGQTMQEAIVPEQLYSDYGISGQGQVEYVITGRTSSWGLNFNQVTWIMVGVLGTVVIVVGFTMFALNKRKLKMGYVPDLDEEEEE